MVGGAFFISFLVFLNISKVPRRVLGVTRLGLNAGAKALKFNNNQKVCNLQHQLPQI